MTARDRLRRRAERGTPRGGDQVWAAAMVRADVGRPALPPRRWLVPAAAAAVAAALVLPVVLLQGDGSDQDRTGPDPTSAAPSPSAESSRPAPTDSPVPPTRADLDEIYRACATGPEFDPGGVQVIVNADGKPIGVKTGVDVPAETHRICFTEIGGDDPLSSSHGNPSPLGECEGVDRTPPIDWEPAPTGTIDPDTVLKPIGEPVRPADAATLAWDAAGLEVPRDVVVECWNGQAWVGAYVARWLREGMPAVTPEFGPGVEVREGTRPVDGTTLDLPVPGNVPSATYRVVAEAALCGEGGCTPVPFEVEFTVTG